MTPQTETDDPNDDIPGTPRTARSVVFVPLSPKSQATLRRHREAQEAARSGAEEDSDITSPSPLDPTTSSDDDKALRKKSKAVSDDDDESAVEELPDRFDGEGRPLTAQGHEDRRGGVHSRKGSFEYRSPKGPNGLNMMGDWAVSGTDKETVERIVQNVTGVLEGKGSWMGLIGGLLSGNLLQGGHGEGSGSRDGNRDSRDRKGKGRGHDRSEDEGDDEDDDRYRRRKRTDKRQAEDERGESSRGTKKGRHDSHDYDHDDDDYYGDEDRKRRRSRRSSRRYHRDDDDSDDRERRNR